MQYVVYPAVISFAGWVYKKYMITQNENEKKEIDKQRESLNKAIKEAKSDEDIINLSVILRKLDQL